MLIIILPAIFAFAGNENPLPRSEVTTLFEEGNKLFREANELAASDQESARGVYLQSAMRFERIIRDGGIRNGRLFYNTGNAYFLSGDIGRAILNYRKAQDYIPNDINLKQNLEYARERRVDRIEITQKERVLETLFFWHYDISRKTRSIAFGVFFVLFWLTAGTRLFVKRSFAVWTMIVSGIFALMFLVSLLIDIGRNRTTKPGVIIQEEVIARKGDSETYEPSFKEPLHAGTEFELLESRHDWHHVALADGRTCWLPSKTSELVR